MQRVVSQLTRGMREAGDDVVLTWGRPSSALIEPTALRIDLPVHGRGIASATRAPAAALSFARVVVALAIVRPDVVNVHFPQSELAVFRALRPIFRYRLVASVHGSDISTRRGRPPGLFTRLLGSCEAIIAVSHELAEVAGDLVPIDGPEIMVVPNALDVDWWHPATDQSSEADVVLFVGRLMAGVKGVADLLEAFAHVVSTVPGIELRIVGDGSDRDRLEALAVRLGIDRVVTFLGTLPASGVRQELQRAALFVAPSRREGLPMALLEALACGTPIIATSIPPHLDVLHGTGATLVRPSDPADLADGLIRSLQAPADRERLRGTLREAAVTRFGTDSHVQSYRRALQPGVPAMARLAVPGKVSLRTHDNLPLRLGVVTTELFSENLGGFGGFGFASRLVGQVAAERDDLEVTFIVARSGRWSGPQLTSVDGHRTIITGPNPRVARSTLRKLDLDLLLTIDYRSKHRSVLQALPSVPVVIWSRDPRPPRLRRFVEGTATPEGLDGLPGTRTPRLRGLRRTLLLSAISRRPVRFATVDPDLADRVSPAYGLPPVVVHQLPNPVVFPDEEREPATGAQRRDVVVLGRLDPVKRPWVVVELARRMPDVSFHLIGRAHFHTDGPDWLGDVPRNVTQHGHVDGSRKLELLTSASILLNTSITEGLAVSFLEALSCHTPIVAAVDTGGVASRFGRFVGHWPGDGLDGLGAFEAAIRELLGDPDELFRLGHAGSQWVRRAHGSEQFASHLSHLAESCGVRFLESATRPAEQHVSAKFKDK